MKVSATSCAGYDAYPSAQEMIEALQAAEFRRMVFGTFPPSQTGYNILFKALEEKELFCLYS
jgi:hypothetical protein